MRKWKKAGKAAIAVAAKDRPTPLSPDAFSTFASADPQKDKRCQEVGEATKSLMKDLIPMLAEWFMLMGDEELEHINISTEFHRHGVNLRHLGLLRSHVKPQNLSPSETTKCQILKRRLLVEGVARTLKNMLREYQRKWMRYVRSSSTQV